MSQIVFSDLEDYLEFEVVLKNIYLFTIGDIGCFRGTLVVSNVLGRLFFSSEIVSYPDRSNVSFNIYLSLCVRCIFSFFFVITHTLFLIILTLICPDCGRSIFRLTVLL